MNELLNKILDNPLNDMLLNFLKLKRESSLINSFRTWKESYSGFDEGGCIFFEDYGEYIPEETKYSWSICRVMVNNNTGEIFAFNMGRFSVFFKCDFIKSGTENSINLKKGYTFDCVTDISELGENWCFMYKFDNPKDQLKWSYELTNE